MASSCAYQTPSCVDLHASHRIGAAGRDDRQAIRHIPEPMLDKTRKHRHHPSNKWFQLISGSAINRHCVGLDLRLLNKNFRAPHLRFAPWLLTCLWPQRECVVSRVAVSVVPAFLPGPGLPSLSVRSIRGIPTAGRACKAEKYLRPPGRRFNAAADTLPSAGTAPTLLSGPGQRIGPGRIPFRLLPFSPVRLPLR